MGASFPSLNYAGRCDVKYYSSKNLMLTFGWYVILYIIILPIMIIIDLIIYIFFVANLGGEI